MSERPVNEYAYAHARIRGRIGNMPDEGGWQKILNAGDLETTIEAMAGSGLQSWVVDFPRHPSPAEIERRCLTSLLGICLFVRANLPERWQETGRWLVQLPHILQLRAALSLNADQKQLLPGSPFMAVMSQPALQRRQRLEEGRYGAYLDEETAPESRWAKCFESTLPNLKSYERHAITRLSNMLETHFQEIEAEMSAEQVWIQRNSLFMHLKEVLAGDPFHIGTLLIYALLECIQFERVRAILLLRAYQWPTQRLGGLV